MNNHISIYNTSYILLFYYIPHKKKKDTQKIIIKIYIFKLKKECNNIYIKMLFNI